MIPRTIFTTEHDIFRTTVQRFIAEEVTPFHSDWEKAGEVPRSLWHKAADLGLLCCNVPESYGGMGGDFLMSAILIEEFALAGATGPTFTCTPTSSRLIWSTLVPRNKNKPGCRAWPAVKPSVHWA